MEPENTPPSAVEVRQQHIRLTNERIRQTKEQLGLLDFEKAKLEAQAAILRQRLASDMLEVDKTITAVALDKGVDLATGSWHYDMLTGEFKKV